MGVYILSDSVNGDYAAEYRFDKVGNRVYSIVNGVHTKLNSENDDATSNNTEAKEVMFFYTHTADAPWTVI